MNEKISSIYGVEPARADEYPMAYKVGQNGVTKIEREELPEQSYSSSMVYHVHKGDQLYCTLTHQAVGEIFYFQHEDAPPTEDKNDD